jgi:hypothetical protein
MSDAIRCTAHRSGALGRAIADLKSVRAMAVNCYTIV